MSGGSETSLSNRTYTSKIIKAGALLADTKTMLAHWDEAYSVSENLERFRRENIFGKASRSRIEDILAIFRQRYLQSESVTRSLVILVREGFPSQSLDRILYFFAAQTDRLLHDIVTEVISHYYSVGNTDISVDDIQAAVARRISEGKITGDWSKNTIVRLTQGLLAALRDFGVLQGAVNK